MDPNYIHNTLKCNHSVETSFLILNAEIFDILFFLRSFWISYLKTLFKEKDEPVPETSPIRLYTKQRALVNKLADMEYKTTIIEDKLKDEQIILLLLPELDYSSVCLFPLCLNDTMLDMFPLKDKIPINGLEPRPSDMISQKNSCPSNNVYILFKPWSLVLKWLIIAGWINAPAHLRYW